MGMITMNIITLYVNIMVFLGFEWHLSNVRRRVFKSRNCSFIEVVNERMFVAKILLEILAFIFNF